MILDVFSPKDKEGAEAKMTQKDPTGKEGPEYWEKKAREAAAKRDYENQERQARMAQQAEEEPPEAPFTVKGSVNLGDFNMQEQQQQLQATIVKIQDDAKTQIQELNKEKETYREELHKIQLDMVEKTMKANMDNVLVEIRESRKPTPGILDQIDQIAHMATALGYKKPEETEDLPASLRLQMMKMEMDMKQSERQFEWDKMQAEREWTLTLEKLKQESSIRSAELANEEKKRNMFISPFESIGAAVARGLLDNGGQQQEEPIQKQARNPQKKNYKLEANAGESGEIDCPECGEKVAIAPTARTAICASCDSKFSIDRIPAAGEE